MRRCRTRWPLLLLTACGGEGAPDRPALGSGAASHAPTIGYAEVEAILARSCAYQRCHAAPVLGGGLSFGPGADFYANLVGVPACEYERMRRVEPGHPEESWLMVKLTAPARPLDDPYATYIEFEPAPDWDPGERACPDQTDEGEPLFGQRMPATAPNMLSETEIALIRTLIADGARR